MTGTIEVLTEAEIGFLSAFISRRRSPDLAKEDDIYGWLVGGWDMRVVDHADAGTPHESQGEWHFARVLEGRAIQDVLIVPGRTERSPSTLKKGNRYGCSLRVFDEKLGSWKVRWNNPVTGAENNLTGRLDGDDITQDGVDEAGNKIRWIFDQITENSFHWYGERSFDSGTTWKLEVEFFGTRMNVVR